jgi:hypothetical protein
LRERLPVVKAIFTKHANMGVGAEVLISGFLHTVDAVGL